jgi:hypothetical protein
MTFGILAGLTLVGVAIANDYSWSASASNPGTWHTASNWGLTGTNFPGGGASGSVRTGDRGLIDNGPADPYTVQFTSASGDTAHGLENRVIATLVLNAATNSKDVKMEVATDELYVGVLKVITDTNDNAEIEVQSGVFRAREVEIDSTTGTTTLDFDSDVQFDQTRMIGDVDVDVATDRIFRTGMLIIEADSIVTKTGDGVMR